MVGGRGGKDKGSDCLDFMNNLKCSQGWGAATWALSSCPRRARSAGEGLRGHSESSSLACKAWWAYLCGEKTDLLMG